MKQAVDLNQLDRLIRDTENLLNEAIKPLTTTCNETSSFISSVRVKYNDYDVRQACSRVEQILKKLYLLQRDIQKELESQKSGLQNYHKGIIASESSLSKEKALSNGTNDRINAIKGVTKGIVTLGIMGNPILQYVDEELEEFLMQVLEDPEIQKILGINQSEKNVDIGLETQPKGFNELSPLGRLAFFFKHYKIESDDIISKNSDFFKRLNSKLEDYKDNHKWVEKGEDKKFAEQLLTLLEIKLLDEEKFKKEGDLGFNHRIVGGDGDENNYIDMKVGHYEASAGISAGLYVYDKNGNQKMAPSVNAKAGASISLFNIDAKGRIGNDAIGGYAEGTIDVGKLAADVGVSASIFDENGKLTSKSVEAKVEGKLELIAAEAKGRAGVTVLGADAGVSGSVNVGIGAHLEAGIVDGVVKVDIGGSFGVGVSVGLDIDVGGFIEGACGAAESAIDGIINFFT